MDDSTIERTTVWLRKNGFPAKNINEFTFLS